MTNILEKYRSGKITREIAAQLFGDLGIDQQKIDFYLKEADNAPQKPTDGAQSGEKEKDDQTPKDDEKDVREAEEAKKSLGREDKHNYWWRTK